jgi:hypothetical protein
VWGRGARAPRQPTVPGHLAKGDPARTISAGDDVDAHRASPERPGACGVWLPLSSNPSGSSGTLTENIIYDDVIFYSNGVAFPPGEPGPESGSWTCSGNQASVTIVKANGTNVWDLQRDAS